MGANTDLYLRQYRATVLTFGDLGPINTAQFRQSSVPRTPARLAWNYAALWVSNIDAWDKSHVIGAITKAVGGRDPSDMWRSDQSHFNADMGKVFGPHALNINTFLTEGMLTQSESARFWNGLGRLAQAADAFKFVPSFATMAAEALNEAGRDLLRKPGNWFKWFWEGLPAIVRYGVPVAIGAYIYKAVK